MRPDAPEVAQDEMVGGGAPFFRMAGLSVEQRDAQILARAWLMAPWTLDGLRARTCVALRRKRLSPKLDSMVLGLWRLFRDRPAQRSERNVAIEIEAQPAFQKLRLRRPVTEVLPGTALLGADDSLVSPAMELSLIHI